eukprot:6200428-Pleurochrysis_carterae.AAC.3
MRLHCKSERLCPKRQDQWLRKARVKRAFCACATAQSSRRQLLLVRTPRRAAWTRSAAATRARACCTTARTGPCRVGAVTSVPIRGSGLGYNTAADDKMRYYPTVMFWGAFMQEKHPPVYEAGARYILPNIENRKQYMMTC